MPAEFLIAATADIHAPRYLSLFEKSLADLSKEPNLLILAGDIILRGQYWQALHVLKTVREHYQGRILACFGNEEFESVKPKLLEATQDEILWLSESAYTVVKGGKTLGIVGSKGCLDRPTRWQQKNTPNIEQEYRDVPGRIEDELRRLSTDHKVLFTHYAPTYGTLVGEMQPAWPEMGSKRLEETLVRVRPSVTIHGHAHQSKRLLWNVEQVPVVNVSLPAQRRIPLISLPYSHEKTQVSLETFMVE